MATSGPRRWSYQYAKWLKRQRSTGSAPLASVRVSERGYTFAAVTDADSRVMPAADAQFLVGVHPPPSSKLPCVYYRMESFLKPPSCQRANGRLWRVQAAVTQARRDYVALPGRNTKENTAVYVSYPRALTHYEKKGAHMVCLIFPLKLREKEVRRSPEQ